MTDFEDQLEGHLEEIMHRMALGQHEEIKAFNETLHPADMAQLLKALDETHRNIYFSLLEFEEASAVLSEIGPELFCELIKALDSAQRMVILDLMSQDDIVDKLGELDDEERVQILAYLHIDDAMEVAELLDYEEDSAGGRMTKEYVTLSPKMTVNEAIEHLREHGPDAETIYYVFVVDELEILLGVISLRELIVAKANQFIEEVMNPHVIAVDETADQEEVARLVKKYDFLVMPVVDTDNHLKGIITVDDVIDVIEEEATEDILKFAGSSDLENFDEDDHFSKRVMYGMRSRLPWLLMTLCGGLLTALVINAFIGEIKTYTILALFLPLLAGMGGSVATQSSTVTVRSIALNEIEGRGFLITFLQELLIAIAFGVLSSLLVGLIVLVSQGQLVLSLVVGIAMFANILTASILGTVAPMAYNKLGFDPAAVSAPLINTLVDITGISIYFCLAVYLMNQWM